MSESYSLARAAAELEQLVTEVRHRHVEVELTDETGPVAMIVPIDEYRAMQRAMDEADLAEAEAVKSRGEWISHEEAMRLLEFDERES